MVLKYQLECQIVGIDQFEKQSKAWMKILDEILT